MDPRFGGPEAVKQGMQLVGQLVTGAGAGTAVSAAGSGTLWTAVTAFAVANPITATVIGGVAVVGLISALLDD